MKKKMFATFGVEKRHDKAQVSRSHKHNSRIGKQTANVNPDGPPPTLIAGHADLPQALRDRLPRDHIRSNAVIAVELRLGASSDFFDGLAPEKYQAWKRANAQWLIDTFGENLLQGMLHEDELVPHIHGYFIPLVDSKLNYRALYGTPRKIAALQTSYALAMKPLGLKRGIPKTKETYEANRGMRDRTDAIQASARRALNRMIELSTHVNLAGLPILREIRDDLAACFDDTKANACNAPVTRVLHPVTLQKAGKPHQP